MNRKGTQSLRILLEGNERFWTGQSQHSKYSEEYLAGLVKGQDPIAAIVACCDSRVSPDTIFDQPLGSLFTSRVPGNVASDSAKWMLEIAVQELQVPLVMVVGHTGCLALQQVIEGQISGPGGVLRFDVFDAVSEARRTNPADVFRESVMMNARQTVEKLKGESWALRRAIAAGTTDIVPAIYEMETGMVKLIDCHMS